MHEYYASWIQKKHADLNNLYDTAFYLNFTEIDSVSPYSDQMSPRYLVGNVVTDDLG